MAKKTASRPTASRAQKLAGAKPTRGSEPRPVPVAVVGIGASAGGLDAFKSLLESLPADTGMAFVLVQHLDPHRQSMLVDILSRQTEMPVREATDGMQVEPDCVYVIPPDCNLGILHGQLQLLKPSVGDGRRHLPVDFLLRSLADEAGPAAIGVILSGTASDGTLGLEAIKAAGGVTFAQDERSAQYFGMPGSAIASGCTDFVLPPAKIARELARIARQPYLLKSGRGSHQDPLPGSAQQLLKIFTLLRARTGHDFTYYKHATIKRRIRRRMFLHKLDDLSGYLSYLQSEPGELDALFHDILINVTSFFREPETFDALGAVILPRMLQGRSPESPLRIWVPGCSSGEEVYSLAMVILESQGPDASAVPFQIFGTDIDERSIEKARAGAYPERISADVSSARLKIFFTEVSGGYQITKAVRDRCVFALHDVTRDPPFSRLDLVCCRNLLIYLESNLQRRVLQMFHYALNPGGFLVLGSSESIGASSDLFQLEHKEGKVYSSKTTTATPAYDFAVRPYPLESGGLPETRSEVSRSDADLKQEADRVIVALYGPAGVIVDQDLDVLGFRGKTGPYLDPVPGLASLNLLKLIRQDLLVDLRNTFNRVLNGDEPAVKEGLRLKSDGGEQRLNLRVVALNKSAAERFFLILFEDLGTREIDATHREQGGAGGESAAESAADARIRELEQELASTREFMKSVIEDQESTNEELQSASEEIQSANEELQSANEELETSKEELQSTNEELATVNEELENRNSELSAANNDIKNLLASVNLPILMLDRGLRVRQFTPQAKRLLNLIETDVGRPIGNIRPNLDLPELEGLAHEVMDSMTVQSREARAQGNGIYTVHLRPYRTHDRRIDGVVIVFYEHAQFESLRRLAMVVKDANDAILVQDFEGRIQAWNPAAERLYGYSAEEALGLGLAAIVPAADLEAHRSLIERARRGERVPPQRVRRRAKDGRELEVWLTLSLLVDESGAPKSLSSIECPVSAPRPEGPRADV